MASAKHTAKRTTKTWTRGEWEQRALELAQASHLGGTAAVVDATYGEFGEELQDELLEEVFFVPSRDRRSQHTVIATYEGVTCNCVAGSYAKPCSHAGAVIHYQRSREVALREADKPSEAWSWWMHGGAYDE